ncbi:DUF4388 domain-containing protein [Calditrichota bacterium LG25]
MAETAIVVLDRSPHQSEYLVQSFKEHEIPVIYNAVLDPILDLPDEYRRRLYLVDYHTLTFEKRESVIKLFRGLKNEDRVIVYNVTPDANKRIVFYELGAFRVFDRTVNIEEVCANALWWYEQITTHPDISDVLMEGRLENIEFIHFLWGLARRKVSGILELTMKRNHGELYFKNGQIIHAQVLTHQGLDGLLHMALWQNGTFSFKRHNTKDIEQTIHNTLLGLIILISDLKLKLFSIQDQFKSEMSVLQLVNAGDLPLYKINLDEGFVEYLSQPREYGDVLENPFYPNHQTMMILQQLKKTGLLRVNEPIETIIEKEAPAFEHIYESVNTLNEFRFDPETLKQIKTTLALNTEAPAKVVVICDDEELLKHYLASLAGGADRVIFEYNMHFIRFSLGEGYEIILIGMMANPQLLRLLSVMSEEINGFIFLINAQNLANVGYYSYLINQSLVQHPVPAACAVTFFNERQMLEKIKSHFFLNWNVAWTQFEANDADSMVQILSSIRPVEPIEGKEMEEEGEEE